jgi:sugar phosphate isomerase/epimerase
MQYGAMNFPVISVLEEINEFARMGFDYLELAMDAPMANHSVLTLNKKDIILALKESGLGLVCHLPTFVSTADLTESLRRASVMEMRLSLDLAVELGAKKVVLHPSMVSGMGPFVLETVKGYAFDFLSEMVAAARQVDVTICLENMFPRYLLGVEPDDFDEFFKAFPSLKLTLDTGHANIGDQQGSRPRGLLERFGKRIGHLHFSDNLGKRDDHLAVGKGTVDFTALVRSLKVIGYDDTLTLEVFDKDRHMLALSREKIKALFSGRECEAS